MLALSPQPCCPFTSHVAVRVSLWRCMRIRFDRLLYLGINMDEAAKLSVLKALTRKFRLADDVDLVALARACPTNFTGADFYAVCSNALAQSLKRRAAELQGTIGEHLVMCGCPDTTGYSWHGVGTWCVGVQMPTTRRCQLASLP